MHIVHLGKYYFPAVGGMESLVRSQANAEANAGHDVEVVVIDHEPMISLFSSTAKENRNDAGGQSDHRRVTVHRVSRLARFGKYDVALRLKKMLLEIAGRKPDIWHLHTPNPTMLAALRGIIKQCRPLVVTHHSDVTPQFCLSTAYEMLERSVYNHATKIISDSQEYIAGSAQLLRYPQKIAAIPLGIPTARFNVPDPDATMWQNHYRQQFGMQIWLCVGRLAAYKGFDTAIRAIQDVAGQLLIVGTGACESNWRKLATSLGVSDRVHWLGNCSDAQLRGAYRAATALWFPSNARNEGFGLVQVEAMASGCPVINTAIPHSGVAWVSQHEKTGLTVPVNDPVALAAAANRLLVDNDLRLRLATAAQLRAAEFDEKIVTQQRLELYQHCKTVVPTVFV